MSKTDQPKEWVAVEITVDPDLTEAVEFGFNSLDALGTEINSLHKSDTDEICVVGYFEPPIDRSLIRRKLDDALRIYGFNSARIRRLSVCTVEHEDWLAEWKKHWKPTETLKFVIAPPWEQFSDPRKIVIRIEPNMAFGTGTHETTKLCISAIERHYQKGMSFLDVGTGTGILAIAASKLGDQSERISAFDTDSESIRIAKANAGLNQAPGIRFFVGSISVETAGHDFVCANVTADIIVPMLPLLFQNAGQIIVLSGILVEQEPELLQALAEFETADVTSHTDGDWIALIIKKPGDRRD